jgi:MerR family transcriptional regulator/heat shock protein HspR
MSRRVTRTEVLRLVGGDEELLRLLATEGLLPPRSPYHLEDMESARLAHTLIHELDVNMAGVEIILRMREEMLSTRRQVAELLELLRKHGIEI